MNPNSTPPPNSTSQFSTATSNSSSSSSRATSSATSGAANQACAACKYQRRKCKPDCPLAPFFPADQQQQFLNAHRLFGVSNILKIIRRLNPLQCSEAMRSIIFESNARANDQVGGCLRIVLELEHQIRISLAELNFLNQHLELYRAQAANPNLLDITPHDAHDEVDDAVGIMQYQQQQQQYHDYFIFNGGGDDNNVNENNNNNNNNNNDLDCISNSNSVNNYNDEGRDLAEMDMLSLQQNQMQLQLQQQQQQQYGTVQDDVKPFIDMFALRQALAIDDDEENSKVVGNDDDDVAVTSGPFHYSNEMEPKEPNPMEQVQEHDLKGAASLFTLTSRNSSYV